MPNWVNLLFAVRITVGLFYLLERATGSRETISLWPIAAGSAIGLYIHKQRTGKIL